MKVQVLKRFKDKHSGKHYSAGDELEITEARYAEIYSVADDLVKKLTDEVEEDDVPTMDNTKAEIMAYMEAHGMTVDKSLSKQKLIDQING